MKKYQYIKTEEKNKGYVLFLLLILMIFLVLGASIIGYTTQRTMQNFKADEHAIKALRIAQSGLEKMIAELEKNSQNCNNTLVEDFAGGYYEVYCNSSEHLIISCGYFMNAKRCVKAAFNYGSSQFIPFAINGTLKIANFHNTGEAHNKWYNASIYAKEMDDDTYAQLDNANFKILDNLTDPYIPLVADTNLEEVFFHNVTNVNCTIGSLSTDLSVDESTIANCNTNNNTNNGTCFVCGNTLTINSINLNNSTYSNLQKLVFVANSNINATGNVTHSGVKNFDIAFLAKKNIYINNQLVKEAGSADIRNILVYAGGNITIENGHDLGENDNASGVIHLTGAGGKSNILILTKGKILDESKRFLHEKAPKDINILIWADKGIDSKSEFFHIAGGGPSDQRKLAILVGNGSAIFDGNAISHEWHFTGGYNRGGLTLEEIENLCNDTTLDEFVRAVYCALNDIIKNPPRGSNFEISRIRID